MTPSPILDIVDLVTLAHLWGFEVRRIKGGSIIMRRVNDNFEWHGQPQSCERWIAAFKRWSETPTVTYSGTTIPDAQL